MRFLVSFPYTSWDWYNYRARQNEEIRLTGGSDEVFTGKAGGKIVLYESKKTIDDSRIISLIEPQQPYGMDYVENEGLYFTCGQSCSKDGEPNKEKIMRINPHGEVDLEISSPLFSHLHSIKRTENGLLVVSTGVDAIFEIDLDGNLLWDWWAVDHGYDTLKSGKKRKLDKNADHRTQNYPILSQTTHVSQALEDPHNDDKILATLYHQNSIIRIDKNTSEHEVMIDGLKIPHHIRPLEEGYMFTNTRESMTVICDKDFKIKKKFGQKLGSYQLSNWVQDTIKTTRGTYLIGDEGNFRLIETDSKNEHSSYEYGKPHRMFELYLVPDNFNLKCVVNLNS